jgi:hypothetical protein
LKPAQGKKFTTPYLEKPNTKRAGGVAQVVEHPPRKHEALSSNTLQKKRPFPGSLVRTAQGGAHVIDVDDSVWLLGIERQGWLMARKTF